MVRSPIFMVVCQIESIHISQGVESWMSRLEHNFHAEFSRAVSLPWNTHSGRHAGQVRVAGHGAGNVTFIRVFDAG